MGRLMFPLQVAAVVLITWSPVLRSASLDRIKVHATDHWFLDDHDRVRTFHGVNAVYKGYPWYPDYLLDQELLDELQSFGLNVVRLGCMWSGAEPIEGQYNQSYIEVLRGIINDLSDRGIYVMLDMHQDVLNDHYDGIPGWLEETYPPPPNPFPWPFETIYFWEQRYLTQEISEGFRHFYDNYYGSIDKWAEFWAEMARQFSPHSSVLGYNLINEPWVGDFYTDPTLIFPGVAGSKNLARVYETVNTKIREVDADGIIFYEPVMYGQAGFGDVFGSGLSQVPGGDANRNVSAYSFHMYCWAYEFLPADASDQDKQDAVEFCNTNLLPLMKNSAVRNIAETGGAAILTEFGICRTWQDDINVFCRTFMEIVEEAHIGWVEWGYPNEWYNTSEKPWTPIWGKINAYLRTYAPAVAGVPLHTQYNDTSLEFRMQFLADVDISQPTEVFIPPQKYSNGFTIRATPDLRMETVGFYVHLYNDVLSENTLIDLSVLPNN